MLGIVALLALSILWVPLADAQQPAKVPRIGILTAGAIGPRVHQREAFRQRLRELGYVEDQSIVLVLRSRERESDRLADLAAELVRLKVDIIVAVATQAIASAQQATTTIPIVMVAADPVGTGLVASLARPGGNTTGLSLLAPELSGKWLELLKEVLPGLSRVAVIGNPANLTYPALWRETKAAGRALGVQLQLLEVLGPDGFEGAFGAATKGRAGGFLVLPDPLFLTYRTRIVALAAKSRLPGIYPLNEFPDAGGLMSYSANLADGWRRAATYVDKILKGAKPADLPVEQPTKFELVVNLKTAKALGLTIPQSILIRADQVIR